MDSKDGLKRKRSSRFIQSGQVQSLHSKNPYHNSPPDFAALATGYPEILGDYVQISPASNKGHIDFTHNDALRALTKALLLKDFGVNVEIPADHLCPPLPNRLNYLCWISDLIEHSKHSTSETHTQPPLVLDIGVGPVCIYPILGNKVFGWNFVGSDVDASSVAASQQTIDTNPALREHIRVVHVPNSDALQELITNQVLPTIAHGCVSGESGMNASDSRASLRNIHPLQPQEHAVLRGPVCTALHAMGGAHAQMLSQCELPASRGVDSSAATGATTIDIVTGTGAGAVNRVLDVVMTNPPFYNADEQVMCYLFFVAAFGCIKCKCSQLAALILQIQASERTVCTGSTSEMRTLGGEVAFVAAIVYDSLLLRDRCELYSHNVL